jgi:hypothetical protein
MLLIQPGPFRMLPYTALLSCAQVGISPVCVLGLNTNAGQIIDLRLRTDDLKVCRQSAMRAGRCGTCTCVREHKGNLDLCVC